jgi:DNA-binding NtrC family response regulator
VLLITPDVRFGRVTAFLLSRSGFVVKVTRRPDDAVAAISQHEPSIVILDCGDSLAEGARRGAAIEALYPELGVIVVGSHCEAAPSSLRLVPKWGPFEQLVAEVYRAFVPPANVLTPLAAG